MPITLDTLHNCDLDRWDRPAAATLARLSLMAYQPERDWPERSCRVTAVEDEDTRVVVASDDAVVVVAFRGSRPRWRDWFSNFDAVMHRLGPVRFHRGYVSRVRNLQPIIEQHVREIHSSKVYAPVDINYRPRLIYTGHSAGGGMAVTYAGLSSQYHLPTADLVYTYGAPRVCDRVAARSLPESMSNRIHRVVRPLDPVPWSPVFNRLSFAPLIPCRPVYRHVGQCHLLHNDGRVSHPVSFTERLRLSLQNVTTADFSLDHLMDDYLSRLES